MSPAEASGWIPTSAPSHGALIVANNQFTQVGTNLLARQISLSGNQFLEGAQTVNAAATQTLSASALYRFSKPYDGQS